MRLFILVTFLCGAAFASSVVKVTKLSDESDPAVTHNAHEETENYEEETISSTEINPVFLEGLNFDFLPKLKAANDEPLSNEQKENEEKKEYVIQVEETSDTNESTKTPSKADDDIPTATTVLPKEEQQEVKINYKRPIKHNEQKDVPKPPELPPFDLVKFVKKQQLSEYTSTTPHYEKTKTPETSSETPKLEPQAVNVKPLSEPQDVNERSNSEPLKPVPLDNKLFLSKVGEASILKENYPQLPEATHSETYHSKLELPYSPEPKLPQPSSLIEKPVFYPESHKPGLAQPSPQPAIVSSTWNEYRPEQRPSYRPGFIRCYPEPYPYYPSHDCEHFQMYPNNFNLYYPAIQPTPDPTVLPFKCPEPAQKTEIPPQENYEKQSQVHNNIPPNPTLPPFNWAEFNKYKIVPSVTEKPKIQTSTYIPLTPKPTPEKTIAPDTKLPAVTILPSISVVPHITLLPPAKPPAEISPHKDCNPDHHEHKKEPCSFILMLKKKCPKH